jgi:hypothetical protein
VGSCTEVVLLGRRKSNRALAARHGSALRCSVPSLRSERTALIFPTASLRNDCGYAKRAGLRTRGVRCSGWHQHMQPLSRPIRPMKRWQKPQTALTSHFSPLSSLTAIRHHYSGHGSIERHFEADCTCGAISIMFIPGPKSGHCQMPYRRKDISHLSRVSVWHRLPLWRHISVGSGWICTKHLTMHKKSSPKVA